MDSWSIDIRSLYGKEGGMDRGRNEGRDGRDGRRKSIERLKSEGGREGRRERLVTRGAVRCSQCTRSSVSARPHHVAHFPRRSPSDAPSGTVAAA